MSAAAASKAMKLRVGLCQMLVSSNKTANLQKAKTMIAKAASQGADLIVLPECFNSPYDTKQFRKYSEPIPMNAKEVDATKSPSVAMLLEATRHHRVPIIGGSIPEYCEDKIYNTAMVMSPDSDVITKHRKMHLFDVNVPGGICFRESDTLSPGNSFTVFPYSSPKADLSIGVGVCYDMRFPELALAYTTLGCKMLVYPSAFNMTTGPLHWDILAKGRAVDSQSFVILCSPARDVNSSYVAYGHSVVVSPWGKVVGQLDEKEGILMADIDLSECDAMRKAIPTSQQKRKDMYEFKLLK
ncbi:hypothetical protein WA588_001281 [Blastocystis sp. NMH]